MSEYTGLSAAALALAAQANEKAAKAECIAKMASFNPATADIYQMREYAACVQRIHGTGEPPSVTDKLFVGSLLMAAIIGVVVGVMLARNDRYSSTFDFVAYGFFGALAGISAVLVTGLVICAVGYLFS